MTDSSRPSLASDTGGVLAGAHAFRRRLPADMRGCRSGFPEQSPPSARFLPWFRSRLEWHSGAHCHQSTECLFQEFGRLNHSVFCRVIAEGFWSSLVKLDLDHEGFHNLLSYTLMSLNSGVDSETWHREGGTVSRQLWGQLCDAQRCTRVAGLLPTATHRRRAMVSPLAYR